MIHKMAISILWDRLFLSGDDMQTITPQQSRAARALLNMTQPDLSAASGVSLRTIVHFENEHRQPIKATLVALQKALEEAGVFFIPNGVSLKPLPVYEHSIGHSKTFPLPDRRLVAAHLQWSPDHDPYFKGELVFCLTEIDWNGHGIVDPSAIDAARKAYPILQEIFDLPQTPRTEYMEKLLEYCDRLGFRLSEEEREKTRAAVRRNTGR